MAKMLVKQDVAAPMDFVMALGELQEACGVADLKMSDYGITPDEFDTLASNARNTMGGLFDFDPVFMSHEDCVAIYKKSYS
jgi:alcohol dehydrogenase